MYNCLSIFVLFTHQFSCFNREKQNEKREKLKQLHLQFQSAFHFLWNFVLRFLFAGIGESSSHRPFSFFLTPHLSIPIWCWNLWLCWWKLGFGIGIFFFYGLVILRKQRGGGVGELGVFSNGCLSEWRKNGGLVVSHTFQSVWFAVFKKTVLRSWGSLS